RGGADDIQIPRPRQRPGAPLSKIAQSSPHPALPRLRGRAKTQARSAPSPASGGGLGWGLSGRRIGLLGGSFNPAHGGHLHISRLALQRLGLDEVWWLVSPQNPLKPPAGMAPFADRFAQACEVAAGEHRIRVSGIEAALGSTYT